MGYEDRIRNDFVQWEKKDSGSHIGLYIRGEDLGNAICCGECHRVICGVRDFEQTLDKNSNVNYHILTCDCGLDYGFKKPSEKYKYKLPEGRGDIYVLELMKKNKAQEALDYVASKLLYEYTIITHEDGTIFYYTANGFYEDAEIIFKKRIQYLLGTQATTAKVNEVLERLRRSTYTYEHEFDKPTNWLCFKNGVYDVATHQFFDHTPEFLTRSCIPVNYDDAADCDNFITFLKEVMNESDLVTLQEMVGYMLLRDSCYEKAFMLLGEGANGKSTLLKILQALVGKENVCSVSLQDLARNRFSAVSLVSKLANIYPDLGKSSLTDTGLFKCLVSGDTIQAEQKFKQGFLFTNYAKLIFSCNALPETKDLTEAFFRRWIFFKFPNIIPEDKRDPRLMEKLTTDEELSGILNWAIEGLIRLEEMHKFSIGISSGQVKEFYIRQSSSVGAFAMDCLKQDISEYYSKEDLYNLYVEYCYAFGIIPDEDNIFGKKIRIYAPGIREQKKTISGYRTPCWAGFKYIGDHGGVTEDRVRRGYDEDVEEKAGGSTIFNYE